MVKLFYMSTVKQPLKPGWSATPFLALGLSVLGIIVSDLYQPSEPSFAQRTVRFVIEDAPFASFLSAIGYMIAAYHRSYVCQTICRNDPEAAPIVRPLPASVRRYSTVLACIVLLTYLCVHLFFGIQFTLLPLIAASLLLLPLLADASSEIIWGTGFGLVLISATCVAFGVFPPPFGPPYPLFAGLSYATVGILIERIIHSSPVWPWIFVACGFAIEGLGLFSVVTAGSDQESFALASLPGAIRFISGAAHSGGMLNTLGNWGFCILLIPLCNLIASSSITRRIFFPVNALGRAAVTAYVGHLIAVYAFLSKGFPHNNPGEFAERIPAGTHISFLAAETMALLVGCTVWVRIRRIGPVEELCQRIATYLAIRARNRREAAAMLVENSATDLSK